MDLTKPYVLYTKQGWESMACVKLRSQFDRECKEWKQEDTSFRIRADAYGDGAISYPMDIDWFSEKAYFWALRSAIFVWACAILTVLVRLAGCAFGPKWFNAIPVLWVAATVAVAFGVYADVQAMK